MHISGEGTGKTLQASNEKARILNEQLASTSLRDFFRCKLGYPLQVSALNLKLGNSKLPEPYAKVGEGGSSLKEFASVLGCKPDISSI